MTCILISHNAIVAGGPPVVTPDHLAMDVLTLRRHAIVIPTPEAPVLVIPPLLEADATLGMQSISQH